MVSRLTIKDANKIRYNKYGSALLNMFIKKPRNALKSIPKTSSARNTHHKDTTPSSLFSIRNPETGLITSNPTSVNTIIERLETKLFSQDNRIHPLAPFPWLNEIAPGQPPKQNMIIGKITPAFV
jgi:hypothetical protein